MDAIDAILKAHDLLDELCFGNGFRGNLYFELYNISEELERLNRNKERLITITNQYDRQKVLELKLMDRYFLGLKQGVYTLTIDDGNRTVEFPFCPFFDNLTIDMVKAIIPIERLRQIVLTSVSVCASLTIIAYDLNTLYSGTKQSDRRRNKPTVITPFTDLLAPNYKSKITPIRRAIECSLNGADEKEVARIMNMLFSLKIIRFPEKEIPCTAYMRTFQHEFKSNVSDDKKCVVNFRYHLAEGHTDALIKTQEILIEEPYKTIYSNLCALK